MQPRLGAFFFFIVSINSSLFSYNQQHLDAVKTYSDQLKAAKNDVEKQLVMGTGNFSHYNLTDANLSQLDLRGATFVGTDFSRARVSWCDFKSCNMSDATFRQAELDGSNFRSANLQRACFVEAKKQTFSKITAAFPIAGQLYTALYLLADDSVQFEDANLSSADLTNAGFKGCNFKNGILANAVLNNTDLSGSDFTGSMLDGSNLQTAILSGSLIHDTSLVNCNVQQTDLSQKGVPQRSGNSFADGALSANSPAKVRYLVETGQVNARYPQLNNDTLLHWAARQGKLEIVRYLLDHGAEINAANNDAHTAMSAAVWHNNEAVARLLLDRGLNPNDLINEQTPLGLAARGNAGTDTINLLLQRGADKYRRDISGRLPIYWAHNANASEAIKELLKVEILTDRTVKFRDIIGSDETVRRLLALITTFKEGRQAMPRFILFEGDSGAGKTFLAHAFANETGFHFIEQAASTMKTEYAGNARYVRTLFENAKTDAPSVVLVEEIDGLAAINRAAIDRGGGAQTDDRNTLNQFLTSLDDLNDFNQRNPQRPVIIIGTTNFADALDGAFRQRASNTIRFTNPSEESRRLIIEHYLKNIDWLSVDETFSSRLARETKYFSARQLKTLIDQAKMAARGPVTTEDFIQAYSPIRRAIFPRTPEKMLRPLFSTPMSREEAFRDLVGMETVIDRVDRILNYLRNPQRYEGLVNQMPNAYLLEGPAGTGKTSIVRAVAQAGGIAYCESTGAALAEGGSAAIAKFFEDARRLSPTVLLIDEIDKLGAQRTESPNESSVTELLSQMTRDNSPVIVFGTTNLASSLDDALLSRFGNRRIKVPLPDELARKHILRLYLSKVDKKNNNLLNDSYLTELARQTDGLAGRDLQDLIKEAGGIAGDQEATMLVDHHIARALPVILEAWRARQAALSKQEKHRSEQGASSSTWPCLIV